MTRLSDRKTRLIIETADVVRERGKSREVIIEPSPYIAVIRLKGRRQRLEVSWAGIYMFAARVAADKARAEKKAARKAGKR